MRTPFFLPAIVSFGLIALASTAYGFGLNNIYGSQTIGLPFYAEIPLQSAPSVNESCIRLRAVEGGAEFYLPELKASVVGPANARRIVISSQAPVRNPMIQFRVDVQCGEAAMARDYVLLADNTTPERLSKPPEQARGGVTEPTLPTRGVAAAASVTASSADASDEAGDVILLSAATTLNAMARAIYPDDRAARDAYRAAFAAANPERFAGKDSIGSIPLAAGTRLKKPAGVALSVSSGSRLEQPAKLPTVAVRPVSKSAPTPPAASAHAATRAKGEGKTDRLTVGTPNPQLQMLTDAIIRLEASSIERDKVTSELVGGVSGALNSIIELKEHIAAQDQQVRQLITLQMESERQRALDKEAELGTLGLLGLLLAAVVAGAGLVALNQTLAGRRLQRPQGRREASAGTVLNWDDLDQDNVRSNSPDDLRDDVWAQATDAAAPIPEVVAPAAVPRASPRITHGVTPPTPPSAPVNVTPVRAAVVKPESPRASTPKLEEAKQDMELDGLLDLFGKQKAEVTATMQRLRATQSRDPEEWLALVRQARVAGLMNSEDMQVIIREFKRLFNASLGHEPSEIGLETFPHVTRQVQNSWGRHEGLTLLNSLLFDDREGGRSGFPEMCFEELVTLREVLAVRLAMFGEEPAVSAAATTAPAPAPELPSRAEHKAAETDMIEFEWPLPPEGKP